MKLEGPGRVFSQPACGNEVWIKTNISGTVGKLLSPLAFRPSSPSVKSLFEATVHRHVADIEVGGLCNVEFCGAGLRKGDSGHGARCLVSYLRALCWLRCDFPLHGQHPGCHPLPPRPLAPWPSSCLHVCRQDRRKGRYPGSLRSGCCVLKLGLLEVEWL